MLQKETKRKNHLRSIHHCECMCVFHDIIFGTVPKNSSQRMDWMICAWKTYVRKKKKSNTLIINSYERAASEMENCVTASLVESSGTLRYMSAVIKGFYST